MNIYLVERIGDTDWDQYHGFVVVAKSAKDAEKLTFDFYDPNDKYTSWTRDVKTTDIGVAYERRARIVQGSYKSG